ncbi:hypothetical protein ACFV6G_29395 [Streptomyces lavendulae]|uniref:hypothetical protein n=1 Tax=Streptomyces lavendulae TaxID=1914 RepID=UPI003680BB9E
MHLDRAEHRAFRAWATAEFLREICLGVLAVTEAGNDVVRPVLVSDNAAVQLIGGLVGVPTIAFSYQAQKSIRLP